MSADLLSFDGMTQPIAEWALDYGIPAETIVARLLAGQSPEAAITTPLKVKPGMRLPQPSGRKTRAMKSYTLDGITLTLPAWAEFAGVHYATLYKRLRQGMAFEKAIQPTVPTYQHNGESRTLEGWAAHFGINHRTMVDRVCRRGLSIAEAAAYPYQSKPAPHYEHDGQRLTVREWSIRLGVSPETLRHRLKAGHSFDVVFSTRRPENHRSVMATFQGETLSLCDWARRMDIPRSTLGNRLAAGMTLEDALTCPVRPKAKHRGAPRNLQALKGTGGGSAAQDSTNLGIFSE